MDTMHPPAHERGTIILDASAIFLLAKDAAPANSGQLEHSCLEIIPFLAQQGYTILIPEMVSVEVSHILANGDKVDRLFASTKFSPKSSDINTHTRRQCREFLVKASHGLYPNIRIIPDTGPHEVDAYCKRLQDISRFEKTQNASSRGHHPERHRNAARDLLRKAQRDTDRKDFGARAVAELVKKVGEENREDVIVLSNNYPLLKEIHTLKDQEQIHSLESLSVHSFLSIVQNASASAIYSPSTDHAAAGFTDAARDHGERHAPRFSSALRKLLEQYPDRNPTKTADSSPSGRATTLRNRYAAFMPSSTDENSQRGR